MSGSDYFKSVPTSSILKKREEHIKKTLEWANKDIILSNIPAIP